MVCLAPSLCHYEEAVCIHQVKVTKQAILSLLCIRLPSILSPSLPPPLYLPPSSLSLSPSLLSFLLLSPQFFYHSHIQTNQSMQLQQFILELAQANHHSIHVM